MRASRVGGYFNNPTKWHVDERVAGEGGGVQFAKTEEPFLLLQMQPERVCGQLVLCPLPALMCRLASRLASKRTAFLYSDLSDLGWDPGRPAHLDVCQVLTRVWVFFFPSSASHLRDYPTRKSSEASISGSLRHPRHRDGRPKPTQLCSIKIKAARHRRARGNCQKVSGR